MKFIIRNTTKYNQSRLMRYLGYVPFHESYTRRLGSGYYPRFHIYTKEDGDTVIINIHLDQKKASYQNQVAHSADYEGKLLEKEKNRILNLLKSP